MKKRFLVTILSVAATAGITIAQDAAQAGSSGVPEIVSNPVNYVIVFTIAVLIGTILVMARVIRLLTWQISGSPKPVEKPVEQVQEKIKKPTVWTKINHLLSDSVPVEKEADVLLDHDYDGIKELDNNLPPWWKYFFYLTIVFSFVYLIHYHVVGSGNVQLDEYNQMLADAEQQRLDRLKTNAANVDENTVTILTDSDDITEGKKIYKEKCLVCHGQVGEGNVGPNLTDEYWIHGGGIHDIFKIVKYGFTSKGMLAWQGQLTPVQIQQVSSFVMSLQGSNPPNAKEPQGEKYTPEAAAGDSSAVSETPAGNEVTEQI